MDSYDLYRVISGVITTKHIVVMPPSLQSLIEAENTQKEAYRKAYISGAFTDSQLHEFLIENEILPPDYLDQEKKIKKLLEDYKVEYFESFLIDSKKETAKKKIESMENALILIAEKKSKFQNLTCKYSAQSARDRKLLYLSSFRKNGEPYGWEHISLHQFHNYIESLRISEQDFRRMARSHEWRGLWSIRSESPIFNNKKAYELTSEQKSLVYWSMFYDRIYESHDSPSEDVIKDDLAIDGWLIKRKREADRDKNEYERHQGADEVFVVTKNEQDLQNVSGLNSDISKKRKDARFSQLRGRGK